MGNTSRFHLINASTFLWSKFCACLFLCCTWVRNCKQTCEVNKFLMFIWQVQQVLFQWNIVVINSVICATKPQHQYISWFKYLRIRVYTVLYTFLRGFLSLYLSYSTIWYLVQHREGHTISVSCKSLLYFLLRWSRSDCFKVYFLATIVM